MTNVHRLEIPHEQGYGNHRGAVRRRVLMRAAMRMRGQPGEWPVTIKDIASSGMKATVSVNLFPGARIEVRLPHLGWIPAQVVRTEGETVVGVRFEAIIDPDDTQVRVSGSYGSGPIAAEYRRAL